MCYDYTASFEKKEGAWVGKVGEVSNIGFNPNLVPALQKSAPGVMVMGGSVVVERISSMSLRSRIERIEDAIEIRVLKFNIRKFEATLGTAYGNQKVMQLMSGVVRRTEQELIKARRRLEELEAKSKEK